MKANNVVAVVICLMVSMSSTIYAVGPTIPAHAKYTPCSVTGIVLTNFNQANSSPACPSGYSEKTTKLFVNMATGSIPVVFQDSWTQPATNSCIFVTGVMLPPCYGDDRPICIVTAMSEDFSCEPEEEVK